VDEAPSNRDKLIDAAEALFAEKGYDATTTREIARGAGVPLGLMAYYFGTKSDLYKEVILRRAGEHVGDVLRSLEAARAAAGGRPLSVREMILAYWRPIVDKALRRGPGWRAYVRLLARAAASVAGTDSYVVPFAETYRVLPRALIDGLREAFPEAAEEDVYWAYYFLSSTLIHMLHESGRIDAVSDGLCRSSDLDTIIEKAAVLFEAGVAGMLRGR
jgi:AcrR family transcriptional regulator